MARTDRPRTMVEDYLKVIWKAGEWDGPAITTNAIAATLGVAASSVSGNLKKLARDGLIDYEPYGRIDLSEEGRAIAVLMVRRHRLIETYLVDRLGLGWDEVHDEADALEHAVSDRLLERIDEVLGHPRSDPHGDPIPRPDGSVQRPEARRLSAAPSGSCGPIVRIADDEPEILRYLEERTLVVGTHVFIDEALGAVGTVRVRLSGREPGTVLEVPAAAADSIWTGVDPHTH